MNKTGSAEKNAFRSWRCCESRKRDSALCEPARENQYAPVRMREKEDEKTIRRFALHDVFKVRARKGITRRSARRLGRATPRAARPS